MALSKYKTKQGESRYKAVLWAGNKPLRSKTFRRKVDAEQWLAREEIKNDDQRVGRQKGRSICISEFFKNIYAPNSGVRESTFKDYLRIFDLYIEPEFGQDNMVEIGSSEWAKFFQEKKKFGMGNARLNRVHAVASAMYSLAVKWEYVLTNPLHRVDWAEEALAGDLKYWQIDELTCFLQFTYENSKDLFPVYHFMYETGLRVSEAIALQWDCVNLSQNVVEVRRAFSKELRRIEPNTKSGHLRTISINSGVRDLLLGLYNHRESEFVFTKEDKQRMISYETLRARFLRDVKATGVPSIGIHGLRHTFASHFMMNGGNLYDLKALLGHQSVETTMRYAHLSKNHLANQAALVKFQPILEKNVISLAGPNHIPTMQKNDGEELGENQSCLSV